MCVSMIGVIYAIILAIILLVKSPNMLPEQRRGNLTTAIAYSFLVIPMLIFEVNLFDLILYVPATSFQLCWDGSSLLSVLSKDYKNPS